MVNLTEPGKWFEEPGSLDVDAEEEPGHELDPERLDCCDPLLDVAGEDWTLDRHLRMLMRLLYDSINDHLQTKDFVPSADLDRAMLNVKAELDWS